MTQTQNISSKTNVSDSERIASVAAGTALVIYGLKKRSLPSLLLAAVGGDLIFRGSTGHCALYGALDIDSRSESKTKGASGKLPHVQKSITIGRSAEELYAFWRAPQNLAQIMGHFADVTSLEGENLTHWRVHSPIDRTVEWDSEASEDAPGRRLSWKSLPGTELPNQGSVQFQPAPDGRGTEVTVEFQFQPPLGVLGVGVAKAFKVVPKSIAEKSLRRFKSLVETGEIPMLASNPSGRGASDLV